MLASSLAGEVITLTSGDRVSGTLKSCDDEVCIVAGKRIPIEQILRIDFGVSAVTAPSCAECAILVDGSVRRGKFGGLNVGYVWIADDEIARDRVAAIVLGVLSPAGATPSTDAATESEPPPPVPEKQEEEPEQPAPPPPNPSPAAPRSQPSSGGSRGGQPALWTGTIQARLGGTVSRCSLETNVLLTVRLRENVVPMTVLSGKNIGTVTYLHPEGSVVRNEFVSTCPLVTCSGSGTATLTEPVDSRGSGSAIYRKRFEGEMQPLYGFELEPNTAIYLLSFQPPKPPTYPVTCRASTGAHTEDHSYLIPVVGRAANMPLLPGGDPEQRFVEEGKMIGGYTSVVADQELVVSWAICREGVQCPQPPPVGMGTSPSAKTCDDGPQQDLAQACREGVVSMLADLQPINAEYTRLMMTAQGFRGDYVAAVGQCAAWKIAEKALETALGKYSGQLGAAGETADRVHDLFKDMIKMEFGGLGIDPLSFVEDEMVRNGLQNVNKVIKTMQDANRIAELLTMDQIGLMETALAECTGAITPELHLSAEKHLQFLRQATQLYREQVAPRQNDIRAQLLKCLDSDYKAWVACRAAAECRGSSAETCGIDPHEIFER